jgi:hypothetical protein
LPYSYVAKEMILFAIFLTLLSIAGAAKQASSDGGTSQPNHQNDVGIVCVLPNSSERPTRISPGGMYNPATLTISIDKSKPIPWPHKEPVRIEKIALNQRHLIVLKSDGKRIQSFWFRFSDFKEAGLCVAFDGYQGVQLADRSGALWCKCK